MLNENLKMILHEFIRLAREKGYREETIEILVMLACTNEMHKNFGDTEQALEKMTEFVHSCQDSQTCVEKTVQLAGVKPD